jgi:hypothetical protein
MFLKIKILIMPIHIKITILIIKLNLPNINQTVVIRQMSQKKEYLLLIIIEI